LSGPLRRLPSSAPVLRRPPLASLFPYTTLFRSSCTWDNGMSVNRRVHPCNSFIRSIRIKQSVIMQNQIRMFILAEELHNLFQQRSEERRVGKECRSQWSQTQDRKKERQTQIRDN